MADFKLASAIYNYYNRVAHPIQQNQRYQEIFKPVRGLVFFSIVFTVIKFIATLLMGGEIFLSAVSEIVYNMFRLLLGGCRLFLMKQLHLYCNKNGITLLELNSNNEN